MGKSGFLPLRRENTFNKTCCFLDQKKYNRVFLYNYLGGIANSPFKHIKVNMYRMKNSVNIPTRIFLINNHYSVTSNRNNWRTRTIMYCSKTKKVLKTYHDIDITKVNSKSYNNVIHCSIKENSISQFFSEYYSNFKNNTICDSPNQTTLIDPFLHSQKIKKPISRFINNPQ